MKVRGADLGQRRVLVRNGVTGSLEQVKCSEAPGRFSPCAFEDYLSAFNSAMEDYGYRTGLAGFLELMATGPYFVVTGGPTSTFVGAREAFAQAVRTKNGEVRIAGLAVPPQLAKPIGSVSDAAPGLRLEPAPAEWKSDYPLEVHRTWYRCQQGCEQVGDGAAYRVTSADAGSHLMVQETASGWYGSSTASARIPVGTADQSPFTLPSAPAVMGQHSPPKGIPSSSAQNLRRQVTRLMASAQGSVRGRRAPVLTIRLRSCLVGSARLSVRTMRGRYVARARRKARGCAPMVLRAKLRRGARELRTFELKLSVHTRAEVAHARRIVRVARDRSRRG